MRIIIFFLMFIRISFMFADTIITDTFSPGDEISVNINFEISGDKIFLHLEFINISENDIAFNDGNFQTGVFFNFRDENNNRGNFHSALMRVEFDHIYLLNAIVKLEPGESKIYAYEIPYTYENNIFTADEIFDRIQFTNPENINIVISYSTSAEEAARIHETLGDITIMPNFRKSCLLFDFK